VVGFDKWKEIGVGQLSSLKGKTDLGGGFSVPQMKVGFQT
jgi:hypothetical protein